MLMIWLGLIYFLKLIWLGNVCKFSSIVFPNTAIFSNIYYKQKNDLNVYTDKISLVGNFW